jgi:hypothetical protein
MKETKDMSTITHHFSAVNKKAYRKKTLAQPVYKIEYVDNLNNEHSFKSTKAMLNCHKVLMSNNPYIKSFKVLSLVSDKDSETEKVSC